MAPTTAAAPESAQSLTVREALGILSSLSVLAMIGKLCWLDVDYLTSWWLVIVLIGWCAIGIANDVNKKRPPTQLVRVWQTVSIAGLATCFVILQPLIDARGTRAVWMNVSTQQTTLTRRFVPLVPFWSNVQYVEGRRSESAYVNVRSQNGLPLSCTVEAQGISLDTRDMPGLERFLTQLGIAGNANKQLDVALEQALRASAFQVLGQMTTAEIAAAEGRFTTPFMVGTPLTAVLPKFRLRWIDGRVTVNCRTLFES